MLNNLPKWNKIEKQINYLIIYNAYKVGCEIFISFTFHPNNMLFNYSSTARKSKRSQSALEYMMTYGWAILIIVIVAVILYSMGIFNPSSSITTTSIGFSPFTVSSTVCSLSWGLWFKGGQIQEHNKGRFWFLWRTV